MTDKVRIDDIPKSLPPHPEEERLREAERTLAKTLRDLTDKACAALESDDREKAKARTDAYVTLSQLADVANAGRLAEATALEDQMRLLNPR